VINSAHADLFSSIVNVGAMIGSILGGFLCDKVK
jgi:predicted MFS family arabinose efflux permease